MDSDKNNKQGHNKKRKLTIEEKKLYQQKYRAQKSPEKTTTRYYKT